jgi:hypothetical protein
MKLYGSIINRLEENKNYTGGEIKVGDYATMYYWSDRHAYEVVEVKDQQHISIRQLRAIRTDKNGMSESQQYRYESDIEKPIEELQLTKWGWKRVWRYNKEVYDTVMERDGYVLWDKDIVEKVLQGKEVKRLSKKINISFGVADEYYDYSF